MGSPARWMVVLGAVTAIAGFGAGGASGTSTGREATSPIQHIVIVLQENHSFDEVLGAFCAQVADGLIVHDPCDGATEGTLPDGSMVRLKRSPDVVPKVIHDVASQRIAIDGGKMDGFALLKGCTHSRHYACYSQYEPDQIPNLAALAQTFAVADRTFESTTAASWGGHMVLAAATLDGFLGDNPIRSAITLDGFGCDSNGNGPWWNGSTYVMEPTCIPDASGRGPYRPSPVPFVPTIFDRLDQAGRSWRIYGGTGGPGGNRSGYGWTICPTFFECLGGPQRQNLVPASDVLGDAAAGRLPAFSIVTPTTPNSQHNSTSMTIGDNWIGQVARAVMDGPDWASTAMFVLYDDCGCFYDHVAPPNPDTGVRVPTTIVSPFARPGFTDHTDASLVSPLAFAEHAFGLQPLNQSDASAYDFSGSFDFTQRPLGPVRMISQPIPALERQYLARHGPDPDDPT